MVIVESMMSNKNGDGPGRGGFRLPPQSFADVDLAAWRRDAYTVVLVGPYAAPMKELVARAGYNVIDADDGDVASDLFARGLAADAIVLDFATEGRPPEAVLLFARRTSPDAQIIAVVPPNRDDAFRRAFLSGARDVLPAPPRGEDLLAAIDLVLEPRGLQDLVEELRARGFEDDQSTMALPHVEDRVSLVRLESELREAKAEMERLRREKDEATATFRQQALDAITDRDRLLESRDEVRKKLALARRDLKEREAQQSLLERACEELQRKLKDARDQRRDAEARLLESEARVRALEDEIESQRGQGFHSPTIETKDGVIDPEAALSARAVDEARLAEIDEIYALYQDSIARVSVLETKLRSRGELSEDEVLESDVGPPTGEISDATRSTLTHERQELLGRIQQLEGELASREAALFVSPHPDDENAALTLEVALAELHDLREATAESASSLEAARLERDALKRRLADVEREAADALTRVEELNPLLLELERARRELLVERQAHEALRVRREEISRGPPPPEVEGEETPHPVTFTPVTASLKLPLPVMRRPPNTVASDAAFISVETSRLREEAGDLESQVRAHEEELAALKIMLASFADDTPPPTTPDAKARKPE
jgi:DNA-binding NarL/FixJ family response regulator